MEELIIPPSPKWFQSSIITCAPDNTVIYGANSSLVIIQPPNKNRTTSDIKFINPAHNEKVCAVTLDPLLWNKPDKLVGTIGEDKMVRLWDLNALNLKLAHNAHVNSGALPIGISMVGNNITSMMNDGSIAVWDIASNVARVLYFKVPSHWRVTCMSTNPADSSCIAFGSNKGLVFIYSTKGSGQILNKLYGHESEIVNLCWRPRYDNDGIVENITLEKSDEELNSSSDKDSYRECSTDDATLKDSPERKTDQIIENDPGTETIIDTIEKKPDAETIVDITEKKPDAETIIDTTEKKPDAETIIDTTEKNLDSVAISVDITEKKPDIETIIVDTTEKKLDTETIIVDTTEKKPVAETIVDTTEENPDIDTIEKEHEGETIVTEKKTDVDTTEKKVNDDTNTVDTTKKKPVKKNPWIDLKFPDDDDFKNDENVTEKSDEPITNYLEECRILRKEIDSAESSTYSPESYSTSENEPAVSIRKVEKNKEIKNITKDMKKLEIEKEDCNLNRVRNSLLLSCAKKGQLSIWSRHGRLLYQLTIGAFRRNSKLFRNNNRDNMTSNWSVAAWPEPGLVITTSPSGELLAWNLLGSQKGKPYRVVHSDHSKSINALTVMSKAIASNENYNSNSRAWSLGIDNQLFCVSLGSDRSALVSLPLFNGFVYSIVASPLDPTRIAIGVGDSTIRLFNISRPYTTKVTMATVSSRIKGKVMSIAWHPVRETCLAFGTYFGQVGLMDAGNPSKVPIIFKQYFSKPIYSLSWGPLNDSKEEFGLYVVSDGVCGIYNSNNDSGPVKLKLKNSEPCLSLNDIKITEVSWQLKKNLLAVGCRDGRIFIVSSNHEVLLTLYGHKRNIQSLVWHPQAMISDEDNTKVVERSNWLASGSLNSDIIVFDCGNISNDKSKEIDQQNQMRVDEAKKLNESDNEQIVSEMVVDSVKDDPEKSEVKEIEEIDEDLDKTKINRVIAMLKGHSNSVNCIAWSSHQSGVMVSVSNDGTALVWDVPESKIISVFSGHNGEPIFSVLWSTLHPNFVFTGGHDKVLQVWDLTKYPVNSPKHQPNKLSFNTETNIHYISSKDSEKKKICEKCKNHDAEKSANNATVVESTDPKNSNRSGMLPRTSKKQNMQDIENCWRLLKLMENKEDNAELVIDSGPSFVDHLRFYSSREDANKLLDLEQTSHKDYKRWTSYEQIMLWRNQTQQLVKDATDRKMISDWVVSLTPSVSNKLYIDTCKAYAEQLVESGEALKAASYYLAIHSVAEAVRTLVDAKLYREALCIARVRLSDDVCNYVIEEWAKDTTNVGLPIIAVECYISLGKFNEAAMILSKRPDIESIKLAARLAQLAKNTDLLMALQCRLEKDYKSTSSQNGKDSEKELKEITENIHLIGGISSRGQMIDVQRMFEEQLTNRELRGQRIINGDIIDE